MNSKILLLSIAVISVGLFAMPSTLSLFTGQHSFDKKGDTTICTKCHSDVKDEITNSNYHTSLTVNGECKGCHTSAKINSSLIPKGIKGLGNFSGSGNTTGLDLITGNFTMANGTNYSFGAGSLHAAVTIECAWCHNYSVGAFGKDAHKSLYDNATADTTLNLKGANVACMGCHTKTVVFMNWARKGGYNYTYDFVTRSGTFTVNNTYANITTNNTG